MPDCDYPTPVTSDGDDQPEGAGPTDAKITVVHEEETEIFPQVKRSQLDLSALEQPLMDRKKALREQLKMPEQIIGFEAVKYFVGKA